MWKSVKKEIPFFQQIPNCLSNCLTQRCVLQSSSEQELNTFTCCVHSRKLYKTCIIFFSLVVLVGWCNYWSFQPIYSQYTISLPLKTLENRKVIWCFQGVEKGCTGKKWVNILKGLFSNVQASICVRFFI